MTIHGFRAMFSTILNEKKLEWGFDGDIIEAQLAHKEQNAVRGAYMAELARALRYELRSLRKH